MTTTKDKPKCPYARPIGYEGEGSVLCDMVDKWCLLEGSIECETYEEFLRKDEG